MEEFDLEQAYDEQIAPLMARIIEICKQNKIPMAAEFLVRISQNDEEDYRTTFMDHIKERGKIEHMDRIREALEIRRRAASVLTLTTKNKKGDVVDITKIVG